jgi:hypothetical protein
MVKKNVEAMLATPQTSHSDVTNVMNRFDVVTAGDILADVSNSSGDTILEDQEPHLGSSPIIQPRTAQRSLSCLHSEQNYNGFCKTEKKANHN